MPLSKETKPNLIIPLRIPAAPWINHIDIIDSSVSRLQFL